jgi:hypothetical protein
MKRDDGGGVRLFSEQEAFDEMSTGLASGAITRGRAIKLAGAALVASALGLSFENAAQARFGTLNRKACEKQGGVFCRSSETGQKICCRARKTPCCGKFGAQCCQSAAKCNKGKCVRT